MCKPEQREQNPQKKHHISQQTEVESAVGGDVKTIRRQLHNPDRNGYFTKSELSFIDTP